MMCGGHVPSGVGTYGRCTNGNQEGELVVCVPGRAVTFFLLETMALGAHEQGLGVQIVGFGVVCRMWTEPKELHEKGAAVHLHTCFSARGCC